MSKNGRIEIFYNTECADMDDYLRHNVLSLSALENEQSQSDFVSDQSRDLANNAVLKTLSDYQSLMGGGTSGSPQKLGE